MLVSSLYLIYMLPTRKEHHHLSCLMNRSFQILLLCFLPNVVYLQNIHCTTVINLVYWILIISLAYNYKYMKCTYHTSSIYRPGPPQLGMLYISGFYRLASNTLPTSMRPLLLTSSIYIYSLR